MSTLRAWLMRLRATLRKDHTGRFEEEIKHHVELLAAEYVRRGQTEAEAHYAALRDLGNLTSLEQEYRERNGFPLLENLWRDLKFAVRMLRRNPVYTACCTVTLAVGLGSMITVLCVVSALLWKPLPFPNPERLVVIKEVDPRSGLWTFTEPDLLDVEERSQSFAAVAAFRRGLSALTGAGEPETIQSATVTASTFAIVGIQPIAGRLFHDSEREVVISRALWQKKWQMNPAAVGQAVAIDGKNYTIAGVADLPADLLPGCEILLPLVPKATESRTAHEIETIGRIRAGVDIGQAQSELNTIAAAIARENPRSNAGWRMQLMALSDYVIGARTGRTVWMIVAAVALLWMLACANVAGLQMARSIARRHEMSTRLALGASRGRLFAQTLTESIVLAFIGGLLGVVITGYAMDAIRYLAAESLPRLAQIQMNPVTIGIALGCMLLSTLLFTVFSGRSPGLQGGREIARRDRGRDALIVVQVALASSLLLGASLLLQSFFRLRAVDPGFDPERILMVHVNLSNPGYDSSRRVAFFRDTTERLSRLPEVESAGATNVSPFSGDGTANRFRLEGETASEEYRSASWRAVTPGFFTTLGIPLKWGRLFTDRDANGSLEVVILSESMAKKFWPNQDPIGKRLRWGSSGNPKTIVGIVGDLRDLAVDVSPVPTMFRPFAQLSEAPMTLVIRTKRDPSAAVRGVRREVWAVERNAALEFQSLRQAMSDSILRPRISLLAFAVFALIAMITAAFGLYGLISYRVNQRQQEIGIRLALGCPAASVRWAVQKRCLLLVCWGLAVGLPVAYALSTLMTSLLYQTHPTQPSAYAMVLLVFVVVAFTASYGPARRASRMDPSAAIRYE
jgi:putative ABC transport system permease protein